MIEKTTNIVDPLLGGGGGTPVAPPPPLDPPLTGEHTDHNFHDKNTAVLKIFKITQELNGYYAVAGNYMRERQFEHV